MAKNYNSKTQVVIYSNYILNDLSRGVTLIAFSHHHQVLFTFDLSDKLELCDT